MSTTTSPVALAGTAAASFANKAAADGKASVLSLGAGTNYGRVAACTQARSARWLASLSRQQAWGSNDSLAISLFGQWARTNLDSSERLSAGGASGARGYDAGVLSGDSGGIAKVEWRHDLPELGAGRWQSGVFVDAVWMKINQRPWPKTNSPSLAEEINHGALKSAGVALAWAHRQG